TGRSRSEARRRRRGGPSLPAGSRGAAGLPLLGERRHSLVVQGDHPLLRRRGVSGAVVGRRRVRGRPLEPAAGGVRSPRRAGGARSIYVARFRLAKPGRYTLVAAPDGEAIQGIGNLQVASHPTAPAVGEKAIPSRTPTLASTHGELAALTTSSPPDRSLLRY